MHCIITSLEKEATERNDAQALGLAKLVCTYEYVPSLYMMSDVLPVLSHLSKLFQKIILDFSLIQPLVKSTVTQLENLQHVPGSFSEQVDRFMDNELKDFNITVTRSSKDNFKNNVYQKYLVSIRRHIEDRFPDAGIHEAFSVFNSEMWPDQYFANYGKEQIEQLLVQHYQAVVDSQATSEEWRTFRSMLLWRKII